MLPFPFSIHKHYHDLSECKSSRFIFPYGRSFSWLKQLLAAAFLSLFDLILNINSDVSNCVALRHMQIPRRRWEQISGLHVLVNTCVTVVFLPSFYLLSTFLIIFVCIVQKMDTVSVHLDAVQRDKLNIYTTCHQIPLEDCPDVDHEVATSCVPCTD